MHSPRKNARTGFALARRGSRVRERRTIMKLAFAAAALGLTVFSAEAQAGVIMDISQVGGAVVATASGTLNLGGLSFFDHDNGLNAFVFPSFGAAGVGPAPSETDIYT